VSQYICDLFISLSVIAVILVLSFVGFFIIECGD